MKIWTAFRLLLLFSVALAIRCTDLNVAQGDVTETGNARVTARVLVSDSIPAVGATVRFRPFDFLATDSDRGFQDSPDRSTDSTGAFVVDCLESGRYTVEIIYEKKLGYFRSELEIAPGDMDIELGDLRLRPVGSITGKVNRTHIEPGTVISVGLFGIDRHTRAQTEGHFEFNGLAPGEYKVHISAELDSIGSTDKTVSVTEGDTSRIRDPIYLPIAYYHDSIAVRGYLAAQGVTGRPWRSLVGVSGERIRSLHLDSLGIIDVVPEIGELAFLYTIHLDYNPLRSFPREMGALKIANLTLRGVQMDTIVQGFHHIRSLGYLNLAGTGVGKLPPDLDRLGLHVLVLRDNALTEIPVPVLSCTSLLNLDLKNNAVSEIPEDIAKLVNLEELGLRENQLTYVPDVVGELTKLKTLWLYGNNITAVSESIGKCVSLEALLVSENQLTSLPVSIGELARLKRLNLSGNNLQSFPVTITALSDIEELNVGWNRLCDLEPSVENWITKTTGSEKWKDSQECD